MCLPVLRAIKEQNPECRITFVCRNRTLFEGCRDIDALESYVPPRKPGDLRLGYWIIPPPRPLITMMAECVGLVLEGAEIEKQGIRITAEIAQSLQGIPPPRIVIQPLASRWTPNKKWPTPYWIELVKMLTGQFEVIEVGTESELPAETLGPRFHSFAGKTNVYEMACLISQADFFIGPPSGGMHLAHAFGIPSAIIFGGYESLASHGYSNVTPFYTPVSCAPCWLDTDCPYERKCLSTINPKDVFAAVGRVLEGKVKLAVPSPAIDPGPAAARGPTSNFRAKVSDLLSAALTPVYSGVGSILCFHRVLAEPCRSRLGSNRALDVTPEFLEAIIQFLQAQDYDIVSLDDAIKRLTGRQKSKKFVCFTFDDGYLDTLEIAYPIFKRHELSFAVYLTTSYMEGSSAPWWFLLEQLIQSNEELCFPRNGSGQRLQTATREQGEAAFEYLSGIIRNMDQSGRDGFLRQLVETSSSEPMSASGLMMNWEQVQALSHDPLVTIGAHTINHFTLGKVDERTAIDEMAESKRIIESKIGRPVDHFSYPFGGRNAVGRREFALARQCGFRTMTTTRAGNLFPAHRDHLECLPRFTVSGNYQTVHHLRRLLSGAAPALQRPWTRVVTV